MSNAMQNTGGACCHHHKATPRSEQELRLLQNRLKRMLGQRNGISKMQDEHRYCGDILIPVSAWWRKSKRATPRLWTKRWSSSKS